MVRNDERKLAQGRLEKRMPLDVRIIACLFVASAIIIFFMVALSFFGVLHFNPDYSRPVLFGLVSLDSDFTSATYYSLFAVLDLICAYGLIRGRAYAWWLMLILCLWGLADTLLIYFEAPITATLSLCMSVAIIVWLVYRRGLYNIGGKVAE